MKNLSLALVLIISIMGLTSFAISEREAKPVVSNTFYHTESLFTKDISKPTLPEIEPTVLEDFEQEYEIQPETTPKEPEGRWIWAKVTAYTCGKESCGIYADGYTSIGIHAKSGNPDDLYGIAADPEVVPYGTKIFIPEYYNIIQSNKVSRTTTFYEKIDDTGIALKRFKPFYRYVKNKRVFIRFHLDVRFNTVHTARKWGVKYIPVFVLN